MSVSAPMKYADGSTVGVMRYVTSLKRVDRRIWRLTLGALTVGALVVLFVLLSNLYFIRTITEPIIELTAVARRIAEGSYGVQAEKKYDVSIRDIAPTLLEFAGVPWQGAGYGGDASIEPIAGRSLLPLLRGQERALPQRVNGVELMGKYAIRVGSWKLVHMPPPHGNGDWQLYDLATDLSESHDLAAARPDKVAELRSQWESYARDNHVILPDWVSGY